MISLVNSLKKIMVLAFTCLLALAAAGCSQPPTTVPTPTGPTKVPPVMMTGTLVRADMSAVIGGTIMAAAADAQGQGIILGADGVPINPEGIVAENGAFTLAIDRSFLEETNYKVKLILVPQTGYPDDLKDLTGKPLVITLGKAALSIPLGSIPIQ